MLVIKIFENADFGTVRTVEINEKVYFIANDVAGCLGYKKPADAVTVHCKGSVKYRYLTAGGYQDVKVIPEGDVYRLIICSKLPQAEKFESWVFDEVLPKIRQTGTYGNLDIREVVAETVKQTVTEITKQLIPILITKEKDLLNRYDHKGNIERADFDLRQEVDAMLFFRKIYICRSCYIS